MTTLGKISNWQLGAKHWYLRATVIDTAITMLGSTLSAHPVTRPDSHPGCHVRRMEQTKHTIPFDRSLLAPRLWPAWLAVGLLRLVALLPFRAKIAAGSALGFISYYLLQHRRHVVDTNVALCFPELTGAKKRKLIKGIFRENGIGFFEIAWAWWARPDDLLNRFDVEGLDILHAEQKKGGVLLIGAHFTHLDLIGLMVNTFADIDAIYRRNNNPVFEYIVTRGRQKVFKNVIARSDMRRVIRKLREGRVVWYSPDQDHGHKHSVFAPFFGIAAATVIAGSRLLQLGRATPVFIYHYRDPATRRYRIEFHAPTQTMPSGDEQTDARIINSMIERGIRQQPEQYMWVHRRFKTRPEGQPRLY